MSLEAISKLCRNRVCSEQDANLLFKFAFHLVPSPLYDTATTCAVMVTRFLLLEKDSATQTLRNLEQIQLQPEEITDIDSEFLYRHFSDFQQIASVIRLHSPQSVEEEIANIANKVNVQIAVFYTGYRKVKQFCPSETARGGRCFKIFLLKYDQKVTLLISKKQQALFREIGTIGTDKVIERLYADLPRIELPNIALMRETRDLLRSFTEPLFSLAAYFIRRLNDLFKNCQAARLCKDQTLAESLKNLFQPLLALKADVARLLSLEAKQHFIAFCNDLGEMITAYSLILNCDRCKRQLVTATMPQCGHRLCADCRNCQLTPEATYIDSEGRAIDTVRCFCGAPQNAHGVTMQDSELFNREKNEGKLKFCNVCKVTKHNSLFGEKCCGLWTCASCLPQSGACSFCSAPSSVSGKRLTCMKCRRTDSASAFYMGACGHCFCSNCQVESLISGCCLTCESHYSQERKAAMELHLQAACYDCKKVKPWRLLYLDAKCIHTLCKSCANREQERSGVEALQCKVCKNQSNRVEFANSDLQRLRCIQCQGVVEDTGAQLAAVTLSCSCLLHKHCQEELIDSCWKKREAAACRYGMEIDHSIILQFSQFDEYQQARQLKFVVDCERCSHKETVTVAFDKPQAWTCRCGMTRCALCFQDWDDEHSKFAVCLFSDAYRKLVSLHRQSHSSGPVTIVQCPTCLEPVKSSQSVSVTCEVCSTVFCSLCCMPESVIRAHGLAYHRERCTLWMEAGGQQRCDRCKQTQRACLRPQPLLFHQQFTPLEYRDQRASYQ